MFILQSLHLIYPLELSYFRSVRCLCFFERLPGTANGSNKDDSGDESDEASDPDDEGLLYDIAEWGSFFGGLILVSK